MDVFLQPHSDDLCFSLGATASKVGRGHLVTVFTGAGWIHPAKRPAPPPDDVTALRIAEDRAFAVACGLTSHFIDRPSASLLGWGSFDPGHLPENRARIEEALLSTLDALERDCGATERPWLYVPAGIGGHVDHLAVAELVIDRFAELSSRYRIAFYEDLHYATDVRARRRGVIHLKQRLSNFGLRRWVLPLDRAAAVRKCDLIGHYASQIAAPPRDLRGWSPATIPPSADHEAVWSVEAKDGWLPSPFVVDIVDRIDHLADRVLKFLHGITERPGRRQ